MKLNKAIKQIKQNRNNGIKSVLTYNFLSNSYYVFNYFSSEFIQLKFNKSHEIIKEYGIY